jgi:predicted phage tail protein
LLLAARADSYQFCLKADADSSQVRLTWTPPAPGIKLAIYSAPAHGNDQPRPGVGHPVTPKISTDSSALVTVLENGRGYWFWLATTDKPPVVLSNMVLATPTPTSARSPGTPAGLIATPGNAQVTLKWSQPVYEGDLPVSGYRVSVGTTADFTGRVRVITVKRTAVVIPRLVNGTTYYFRVRAFNLAGVGPQSCVVPATPVAEAPGAPTGLTATPGNTQVTLKWNPPASDGGATVTSYNIYEGTTAGFTRGTPLTSVADTIATVPNLVNGTTYHFQVTAVNSAGEGQASEVAATPAPEAPGPPTGLTATPGNTQVTLKWNPPASDGGATVTGYDLYAGTTADFSGQAPVARVPGTIATVKDLVVGTTYHFQVRAVNRVGAGPPSAEAKTVGVTVPTAPARLTATPGNAQVTLSWAPPVSDGGSRISGYLIYRETSPGGGTGTPVNRLLVPGTRYRVTGLVNGTTYYFRVIAVNAVGKSPPSEEASAKLPPPSTAGGNQPGGNQPGGNQPGGNQPGGNQPGGNQPGGNQPGGNQPGGNQAPAGGTSSAFAAPAGLAADPGNSQVHLAWTALTPDGGSSAVSYKVYFATALGVQNSAALGTTKGTDAIVAGLANGTKYWFMVTAVNAAGNESPFSTEVSATPTELTSGSVVSLTSGMPPKQLIAVLAALAAMAVAGASTLITRRRRFRSRERARSATSDQQTAVAPEVRTVPDTSRPDVVSVRDTGPEPTHTVRLEPHPGLATTTIKEGRP